MKFRHVKVICEVSPRVKREVLLCEGKNVVLALRLALALSLALALALGLTLVLAWRWRWHWGWYGLSFGFYPCVSPTRIPGGVSVSLR